MKRLLIRLYHWWLGDRLLKRRAEIARIRAEIEFMSPIIDRLFAEALGAAARKDWDSYREIRRRHAVMAARWTREVTDKIELL